MSTVFLKKIIHSALKFIFSFSDEVNAHTKGRNELSSPKETDSASRRSGISIGAEAVSVSASPPS